jgi:hypothetical protein
MAWKRLLAEGLVIVVGVLLALFVDGVREERLERRMLAEALGDVAVEIEDNSGTLSRVQEWQFPRKVESLERVIRVLSRDDAVGDTLAFIRDLAISTQSIRPWLVDDRYQALRSSGQLRLVRDRTVAFALADFNRAPEVLFGLADEIRGDYRKVVHEILPPELALDLSPLEGYVPDYMSAPAWFEGSPDYSRTLREFRLRGDELLALAQNEAAYVAAHGHALNRYRHIVADVLEVLGPWRPKVP